MTEHVYVYVYIKEFLMTCSCFNAKLLLVIRRLGQLWRPECPNLYLKFTIPSVVPEGLWQLHPMLTHCKCLMIVLSKQATISGSWKESACIFFAVKQ